ncbi:hypothetical protein EV356DRAFT_576485 [Viridothelium virens]|uniref:Uncharacterized protein n=1 Tax=Viridothelium virens TaxID=1048519 RepID=A0A6A6H9L0_VIRVR|nr:hypothetical protein EV356DRAFT_576485 [Viridothelium virens]
MATDTWQSDSTTSSQSSNSSRFDFLDRKDRRRIIVYKRHKGITVQSQEDLCQALDKDPHLRCSRKPLPRMCSRVDIRTEDLYNEPEKTAYQHYPNCKASLASVGLPMGVSMRRMLFGDFSDLYIVSPESSPTNSQASSLQNSRENTRPLE